MKYNYNIKLRPNSMLGLKLGKSKERLEKRTSICLKKWVFAFLVDNIES